MATPTSTVAEGVFVAGTAVVASVVRSDSSSATTPVTVSTTPVVTPAITEWASGHCFVVVYSW